MAIFPSVVNDFRRGGKGTVAFNALIKELQTECIDLDVFCWNDRGRKFWESLGFKERAIIMRKQRSS
jgi:ribosomal protein S18 acetylase RimI-like enzyme